MTVRCAWAGPEQIYLDYHDTDWGVPEYDSRALWEKLILDGFQAGLSWITILRKRENFRRAFAGFDPHILAAWGEPEVRQLLENPGIIRHRRKIEAALSNARVWQSIEAREGFDHFLWKYVDGKPVQNRFERQSDVPTQTPLSVRISKDLNAEGFKFCGPTIVYAFMEAVGMVNDHVVSCHRHAPVAEMGR
jgi:DNA-3-methyladenine glycosylase I